MNKTKTKLVSKIENEEQYYKILLYLDQCEEYYTAKKMRDTKNAVHKFIKVRMGG